MFSSKEGFGDRPLELACGQCIGCRLRRSREWALRMVHEAQMHERNCFLTLTYRSADLPVDQSLKVEHWQRFAKRLRRKIGPFRFFHCGEYGEENLRPHYHACLFGVDFRADRVFVRMSGKHKLYRSALLDETWGLGFANIGELSFESAAYVARYVMKKVTGKQAVEHYTRVDPNTGECWSVRPEYTTMSRRPGIGSKWFEAFKTDVFPSDEVVHDGKRHRTPRFYDKRLEDAELDVVRRKRRDAADERREDTTPERLRSRERFAVARLSQLSRGI